MEAEREEKDYLVSFQFYHRERNVIRFMQFIKLIEHIEHVGYIEHNHLRYLK